MGDAAAQLVRQTEVVRADVPADALARERAAGTRQRHDVDPALLEGAHDRAADEAGPADHERPHPANLASVVSSPAGASDRSGSSNAERTSASIDTDGSARSSNEARRGRSKMRSSDR